MTRSVELFSGLGALALGFSRAGFDHQLMVEWNSDACATIEENKARGIEHVGHWPIKNLDVREVDYGPLARMGVSVLGGGPPCQPFSIGGKHRGANDQRDMWPEAIRAVRELQPKAFVFENVRGLLRPAFASYLRWITLNLESPSEGMRKGEDWQTHLSRLERTRGKRKSLGYGVTVVPVNAADYGAAQVRRRVLIVGFRSDLDIDWQMPAATHSREALLRDKWISGDYWAKHEIPKSRQPTLSSRDEATVRRIRDGKILIETLPWVTTRDALKGLPEPSMDRDAELFAPNHRYQPGAKKYPGHTGSQLDEPSKALKAGAHGVPGGENMMAREDGSVRYFTVREAARLQGLPDDFVFPDQVSWSECMRQLGNAVPVPLAEFVAREAAKTLALAEGNPSRRRVA